MNLNTLKKNKYQQFLIGIPIVLIAMLIGGSSTVEFQMQGANSVIPKFKIALFMLVFLAIKSGLYYYSRKVSFVPFIYKSDLVLTLLLLMIGLYFIVFTRGAAVSSDTIAILSLVFASWILLQMVVMMNFLFVMYFGEK